MRIAQVIKRDGTYDNIPAYEAHEFDFQHLKITAIKARKKHPAEYIYDFATFDIESTTIDMPSDSYGFMYHWQMCVAGAAVYGRTWAEWVSFMKRLIAHYHLHKERRIAIYVHNLAFEFQFIRDFLNRDLGGFDLFATGSRTPLRLDTETGLEFRCSYKLTNMTLEAATLNEYGVEHIKAAGDLDYKKIRTPDTPLNDIEFGYCISDVISLYELIKCRMKNEGDNIDSIPMTSTGYVRRDCRRSCRNDPDYWPMFHKLQLPENVYIMLKEAGRGGNTHANRYLSGRIWGNVDSYDFVSDYPAQMMLRKFPMSKFEPYGDFETNEEFQYILDTYACLFHVTLVNPRVKNNISMPYIAFDKALSYINKSDDSPYNMRLDNGRLLQAPMVKLCITDIDWKIIKRQYDFDEYYIEDMHIARYGDLPQQILCVVMDYFRRKTDLKAAIRAEADIDKKLNLQYLYGKAKNRLNGIFGMCYTDPVHELYEINEAREWRHETPDIGKTLEKYNRSRNSFLYYAWGIWITCWARLALDELIIAAGEERVIYCDTDSAKVIQANANQIEAYNRRIITLAEERGAYADEGGKRYYMGIAEKENKDTIAQFKTLGAKKYCYIDGEGMHITISGVSTARDRVTKIPIAVTELKTIDNFKPGFIFRAAGGKELVYNDSEIHFIEINGVQIETASNIAMLDSTYTIGITGEYAELIGCNIYYDIDKM